MTELPGLERVRARFIDMLAERHDRIAGHAIAAWDAQTAEDIIANLNGAKGILHQIAGTAGSLGLKELGEEAHFCENEIIAYLQTPQAQGDVCPGHVIQSIDQFLENCRALI